MTIAKRLVLLLAIPLLALFGLGAFVAIQTVRIERLSRFVAETQIASLGQLGEISRHFAQARVCMGKYLLATDKANQDAYEMCLRDNEAAISRLLVQYGNSLVSSDEDRRLYTDFGTFSREYARKSTALRSLAKSGRREEAEKDALSGSLFDVGERATSILNEWTEVNVKLAKDAANSTLAAISNSRRNMLIAVGVVMVLSGTLGFFTFRRIVYPVRALQVSVERIASGKYGHSVPSTMATDETGALARSVDVLRKGAAAREEQRWIKASVAAITHAVQGAASHAEFGNRLVSELVPMLRGGVAGLYIVEPEQLSRVASYGLADEAAEKR